MRKIYNIYVLLVAVVAMAFTSCQGDDNNLDTSNRRGATTFTANFDASRSYFGDKVDGAYPSYWSGDERVMLEIVTSDFLSIHPSESIAMDVVDEAGKYASFTATIEQEFNGGSVYAYVPAASWEYGTDSWGISSYSYKLPTTQTPTATSVDPAAHILRAEYIFEGALPTDVDLTFEHVAAYCKLSIPALEGEDVQSMQIDLTSSWGTEYSYTLNVSELNEPTYWFACESDLIMAIGITAVTADKSYTYERTFDSGSEVFFSTGHVRPLTVAGELIDPSQPEPTYPNCEIHYIATTQVEAHNDYPWTYDTFGANIVSNEWNSESGEGVITFDADVTTIGDFAFYNCTSLTSVTIPDNVTTIGVFAYSSCYSLTSVTIGDSVTTIGNAAFRDCDSLTSVTIGNSVTTIGASVFYGCSSLTSITIPDSVTTIGYTAFYDCDNLTSVYCEATTPPSLSGAGVFYDNASDRKIYVPAESVEAYKSAAGWSEYADAIIAYDFENGVVVEPEVSINNEIRYTATTQVEAHNDYPWTYDTFGANIVSNEWNSESGEGVITFDADVTTIGDFAFYNCDSLTSVTIPDSVTTIGDVAFYHCNSLTSITIPDSVTTIGYAAFSVCTNLLEFNGKFVSEDSRCLIVDGTLNSFAPAGLTSYTIPDSVTTIGEAAFVYCDNLTSVTIGDSVTTIGDYAFAYCSNLTSITIPDSVKTIGDEAFLYCSSLTSITIPDSVTTIGEGAFYECDSLTSVTIPDSVTTIGDYAFENCDSLTSVTIGDCVTTIGYAAFAYCSNLTSITIPDSVKTIGDYAFYECNSLTSVTIGDCVTTIGYAAFAYCSSLTSLTIPDSVTTIGYAAFAYCDSLTNVTIPDSVTTIGDSAFAYCFNLTSVTIGDSVTTIGEGAFEGCSSFTSITIPDSVTTIGISAFAYCYSLTSVYCEATTPPSLSGNDVFDYNASGRKIYVPAASVEAYKSAEGWSGYASYIVGYDFENGENDGDPNTTTLNTFVYNADLRGNYLGYLFKATAENVELGICIGSKSCSKTSIDAGDYTYSPYPEDLAYAFQLRASNINGTDVSNDPNATMNVAVNGSVYTITIVTKGYTLTYNGTL